MQEAKKITVPIVKWNVTASYSDKWEKSKGEWYFERVVITDDLSMT